MHRVTGVKVALCAVAVFVAVISLNACGATKTTPTGPSQNTMSASNLAISGFTTLSAKGETGRLSAMVTFSDGSIQDKSSAAQWASANQTIATVNSSGMVTALNDGRTTITATFGNVSGSRTILVDLP